MQPPTPIDGGTTVSVLDRLMTGGDGTGLGLDLESDPESESADRALTSVRRKLDNKLSIEYTVNELIVSAMDPTNLAMIFAGKLHIRILSA